MFHGVSPLGFQAASSMVFFLSSHSGVWGDEGAIYSSMPVFKW